MKNVQKRNAEFDPHWGSSLDNLVPCLIGILLAVACKEPYLPPQIRANPNFLVVDGVLHAGQDSTIITLSRARNLVDSAAATPELNAQVTVEGDAADLFPMVEGGNGTYVLPPVSLINNEKYRLKIILANGQAYASDYVPVKISPPIDSVFWELQADGVHIFLSTHDPLNQALYYRWQFVETWNYHAFFDSGLIYDTVTGLFILRKPAESIYNCWITFPSSTVLVGSSGQLDKDIVFRAPITTIPLNSEQISIEYSIQVIQQSLTLDGLTYWENQQKNSENLGSVFAPQPVQLTSNIHSLDHPGETVLGYFSASSLSRQRIFINRDSIPSWDFLPNKDCELKYGGDIAKFASYEIIPISLDPIKGLSYSTAICVDCRVRGGVNSKPSFWP